MTGLIFLMYALFGSIFSVGKLGLTASQPFFLTSVRMLLASSLILSYFFYQNKSALKISKQEWILLSLVGFFNVFITNAFEFWGLQYMTSGKTCLIYSLPPFVAAFLGYILGTEQLNIKKILGLMIGFCSFCPLMLTPWLSETTTFDHSQEFLAEFALMTSAVTAVIGWTFVKKLTVKHQTSPLIINGLSFFIAGLLSLLTSLSVEDWHPVPVFDWTLFILSLLYIVIIHNLICYTIYAYALKRFSITFMSFAGLSSPLFAAFFGWLFLQEPVDQSFWLAFAGVLIGLSLYYLEEKPATVINS